MNYVCLDVGNVLVHVDFQSFINDLSEQLNITLEEAEYFMNRTHALHDIGLTTMSDELRDHFKIRSTIIMNKLLTSWNKIIKPNYSMVDFMLKMMKNHETKVALLSNMGLEHAVLIELVLSHHNFFQQCVKHLSCQVGARKPTKLYFQSFLFQYPEFYGAAYLDDLRENLNMGAEFGFRPLLFNINDATIRRGADPFLSDDKQEEIKNFILDTR
jgi:FMN phosphatase YigB (HAD superfamily)